MSFVTEAPGVDGIPRDDMGAMIRSGDPPGQLHDPQ